MAIVANITLKTSSGAKSISRHLYSNKTLRFARDDKNNEYIIDIPTISGRYLEIFSIVYDNLENSQPLVYVRECGSNAGISINGVSITLLDANGLSAARLLEDGDEIAMGPEVTLSIRFPRVFVSELRPIQAQEVKILHDRYTVTNRTLGRGSFAKTNLAIESDTGRQVACKIINLHELSPPDIQLTLRSIEIMQRISHFNIASFQYAYLSPHTLYIFEELATGGDLFTLITRVRSFQELDIKYIMRQILQGVRHLHENGIVHRDLKLENILCAVCPDPEYRLVLTDFGTAAQGADGRLIDNCGTPGYQAPEMLLPGKTHGLPVDMWAIGVIAANLLIGDAGVIRMLDDLPKILAADPSMYSLDFDALFDDISRLRGEQLSYYARIFLRRCLEIDPLLRITADQALNHDWLTVFPVENNLFLSRDRIIRQHWRPRGQAAETTETLPDVTKISDHETGAQMDVDEEALDTSESSDNTLSLEDNNESDWETLQKLDAAFQMYGMVPKKQSKVDINNQSNAPPAKRGREQSMASDPVAKRLNTSTYDDK